MVSGAATGNAGAGTDGASPARVVSSVDGGVGVGLGGAASAGGNAYIRNIVDVMTAVVRQCPNGFRKCFIRCKNNTRYEEINQPTGCTLDDLDRSQLSNYDKPSTILKSLLNLF
jgi:hypothetical protein